MSALGFSGALVALKAGRKVARAGWNGKGMWIALWCAVPPMTLPYLYLSTVDGSLVPWLPSQTDILAEDWQVVP